GRAFAWLLYRFAERGYNVVIQTTRGRFNSGGEFAPLLDARADGRETLEWVAQQPWFDGNLGMWGPSWLGYMQWAAASGAPPYLKAIVPSITASQFHTYTFPDGAFGLDAMLRWLMEINLYGVSGRQNSTASSREVGAALAAAFQHLPMVEADTI